MKVLKVFVDFADAIGELNDAERGRLFTAMLEYARSGAEPVLRGGEKILWPVAKGGIDNQRRAYDHICSVNKNNALNRNEPKRFAANRFEPLQDKEKEKRKKYIDDNEDDEGTLCARDPIVARYDAAAAAIRLAYLTNVGRSPSAGETERLSLAAVNNDMDQLLAEAIARASWNGAKNPAGYAVRLLEDWAGQDIRTVEELVRYDRIMEDARKGNYSATEALQQIRKIKEG